MISELNIYRTGAPGSDPCDTSVASADRLVCRAAVVFPSPGLVWDAVDLGELPQRDAVTAVDLVVSCRSQCFPLLVS